MRIAVLGGGQVATAVSKAVPAGHQIISLARSQLDIVDDEAVARVVADVEPDWIVNAAAYTAVDLAEDQPDQAYAVNDSAVASIARAAARHACRLLHLSTDFVFDGSANRAYGVTDQTNPLSVYGASKLNGERHVTAEGRAGIVLRTSWVYAASGKNFVLTMLRLMREKPTVSVVCDQIGTPTAAHGLAEAIWACIDRSVAPGIYHWADLGVASWYDFAVAVQEEAHARGLLAGIVPILPIKTAAYPTRARRPAFSVLDTAPTQQLLGVPNHHWRHNLRAVLDELRTA